MRRGTEQSGFINPRPPPQPLAIIFRRPMPTNFWSIIRTSFRRTTHSTFSTEVHVDDSINQLPGELILMVADNLPGFTDISSSMRTNRRHLQLLMPIILDRAIISPPSHTSYGNGNRTILHWAAIHHPPLLQILLQRSKVDTILNVPDRHGVTPLHSATLYKRKDIVKMLLDGGANINATMDDELGDGWTPLHCAVLSGHAELIWILLAAGADTEARTDVSGDTALFLAALQDDQYAQRLLIQFGAKTLARRKDGSNIQEFVQRCEEDWFLEILPRSVWEWLLAIERTCRCIGCTKSYTRNRSYKKYPKGSTR